MIILSICSISFSFLLLFRLTIFFNGLSFLVNEQVIFLDFEILRINSSLIEITILFDWISFIFMSFVSLISSMVIFYRKEYILIDKRLNRFILLVLIFVLSIIFLIISPNIIRILLGWDGLGLVSYCLVIYFQNIKSYNAGILTALSNRIGDIIILLSIAWILNLGSWRYIFYLDLKIDFDIQIISLLVIIARITKSAQIPFSAWLPAAIAAPTPVSALVHSSTLVTAGIYLLIRFNNLILINNFIQILLLLRTLTMFMAGLGANFEFDLKKIIALSTLRQLGLIIRILCLGFPLLAFFHLLTHALFKALLFICAGIIIHLMKNFQDIRYIGSLVNQLPITTLYFNIANLALCGFPFLTGFYSKDLILEIASFYNINLLIYILFFISTGLTVCYSLRLMYYSLYRDYKRWGFHLIIDNSSIIIFRIRSLIILSILGGCLLRWLIFPIPELLILPNFIKLITLVSCILGGLIGHYFSNWTFYIKRKVIKFQLFFYIGSIWFLPIISTIGLIYYPIILGNYFLKVADNGWSEEIGAQNLNKNLTQVSQLINLLQNNNLKIYLMYFFLWVIIFLFWIL